MTFKSTQHGNSDFFQRSILFAFKLSIFIGLVATMGSSGAKTDPVELVGQVVQTVSTNTVADMFSKETLVWRVPGEWITEKKD